MRRLVYASIIGLALAGCGGANGISLAPTALLPQTGSSHSPIQHVVIVIQENRSFDNLFDCFKGTACVTYGKERVLKNGRWIDKRVNLTEQDLVRKQNNTDIGHCFYSFMRAYDKGKMDGFNREPYGVCPRNWPKNVKQINAIAYAYVNPSDIAPYWDIASQYVLADRTFQTQGSGSFTAHQDLIRGGTALGGQYGSSSSLIDTPDGDPWGCDALSNVVTDLISTSLVWGENNGPQPCTKEFPYSGYSNYQTMRDLLDAAGVSWKYYSPCFKDSGTSGCQGETCTTCIGGLLNAFDVIAPVRYGPEWGTNVSMPQTNILTDIQNNALPAVSWLIPSENDSDHPGDSVRQRPRMGCKRRQRDRAEQLLEQQRDRDPLGRLGWPLRSREAAGQTRRPGRLRFPRADDDRLAVRRAGRRFAHAVRIRQHPEVRRTELEARFAGYDRSARQQHRQRLQLQPAAANVHQHPLEQNQGLLLARAALGPGRPGVAEGNDFKSCK